jgi:hypothetical protein
MSTAAITDSIHQWPCDHSWSFRFGRVDESYKAHANIIIYETSIHYNSNLPTNQVLTKLAMSTVIRPTTLLRSTIHFPHPFLTTLRIASQRRSVYLPNNDHVRFQSTSLRKEVKEAEEAGRGDTAVVGGSGQGAEGVHFQGQPFQPYSM